MQTQFTPEQLATPEIREANSILRACVHCGFCTATCPTYVLTGDERDSPRGRIYLIKDMLESGGDAASEVARHVDRCLSCLGCMTTCPSGVDYMHLVDHARTRIEDTYRRPWVERALRALIAHVLPHPARFRRILALARLARPVAPLLPGRLRAMLELAPERREPASAPAAVTPARGLRRQRVALLAGCVQPTLAPRIGAATRSLLSRHGCEVVIPDDAGCCGALPHHMGRNGESLAHVRANIAAWWREIEGEGLDAIVVDASGCGAMVKDYGHLLRDDPEWADRAARVSELARDVTEFAAGLELMNPSRGPGLAIAYHGACSLRHGQKIDAAPRLLLAAAGFEVREPADAHLCCGAAGTYNILQPHLADQLGARKSASLDALGADAIATGNIGCLIQIGRVGATPVVHTVELLDWATGGPRPTGLPLVDKI